MTPFQPHPPLRLRIGTQPRDEGRFPRDDDALGEGLLEMARSALTRGAPPPALFVLRLERVDTMDLRPVLEEGVSVDLLASATAGQEGVEAIALVSVMNGEGDEPGGPAALTVFLEWPDCRWWHAVQPLGPDMAPMDGLPAVARRAVDGLPRPVGLGGWFSKARFHRLRLQMSPVLSGPPAGAAQLVH